STPHSRLASDRRLPDNRPRRARRCPRNARNAAEIRGFCAAVPEVRIHLPPAVSQANFHAAPLASFDFGQSRRRELRDAAHQQGADLEMIVVGGGSRDRTLEGARPQSRSPSGLSTPQRYRMTAGIIQIVECHDRASELWTALADSGAASCGPPCVSYGVFWRGSSFELM